RVLHARGDELPDRARRQPLLGLALELRIEYPRGEHVAERLPYVLRLQAHAAREQLVVLAELLDRFVHGVAQPRLVRAAERRRDEVHERFAFAAGFRPRHRPGGAFAFGVRAVLGRAVRLAREDRAQVAVDALD